MWENRVLFLDGEAIVIDKPAGLAVHAGPRDAARALKIIFTIFVSVSSAAADPGPPARPRHFAAACCSPATPRRTSASSARSRSRQVTKTYVAVLDGVPEPTRGTIDMPLGKVSTQGGGMADGSRCRAASRR